MPPARVLRRAKEVARRILVSSVVDEAMDKIVISHGELVYGWWIDSNFALTVARFARTPEQEHGGGGVRVELVDHCLPIFDWCGAIESKEGELDVIQQALDQIEALGPLAEDEHSAESQQIEWVS
tara:strand:- start:516 stop:890 length:375 start_codon:yes stop_codon:yes gene_type:complete